MWHEEHSEKKWDSWDDEMHLTNGSTLGSSHALTIFFFEQFLHAARDMSQGWAIFAVNLNSL